MSKVCLVGATIFFTLFIVLLAMSLYMFSVSLSMISRYGAVSLYNVTEFLIYSIISLFYLLLAVMLLLASGVMLYGAIVVLLRCEE